MLCLISSVRTQPRIRLICVFCFFFFVLCYVCVKSVVEVIAQDAKSSRILCSKWYVRVQAQIHVEKIFLFNLSRLLMAAWKPKTTLVTTNTVLLESYFEDIFILGIFFSPTVIRSEVHSDGDVVPASAQFHQGQKWTVETFLKKKNLREFVAKAIRQCIGRSCILINL